MNPCTRRTLLAATSAAVVAGCLDETSGAADPSGGSNETSNAGDDDPSSSDDAPDQSGDPASCPKYDDRVERVVCYNGIDVEEADVYLEPDVDAVAEGEAISFTLKNGSGETLQTNFYNWRVDKYVDDEWHRVAPMGHNDPLMSIKSGQSHTWTVTVDNADLDGPGPVVGEGGTEDLTLTAVGAGQYAFRARGWLESESHEDATAFAATFELEGESLELTPSAAIEDAVWNDDTLVAESSRGDSDGEYSRLGAFELERVDDPEEVAVDDDTGDEADPQTVITEQLYRHPQLRDTIALAVEHDADRVRLEEYNSTSPIFGSRSDGVYEYRDEYYRVSTRELEE